MKGLRLLRVAGGLLAVVSTAAVPVHAQLPGGGTAMPATGVGSAFELTFWQSVAGSEDRAQLQAYLDQYPGGTFSALARAKIATIDRLAAAARGAASTPAPAPAPAPQTAFPAAPAVAPQAALPLAVPAAPPPDQAVPAAASAPLPARAPADATSLADELRALGLSQGARRAAQDAPVTSANPNVRPAFAAVPEVRLPGQFCSAVERNAYYDATYKPARDLAEENNRAAIAYLNALRQRYDEHAKVDAREAMNAIAAEAKDYEPVARGAYEKSASYEALFNQLMAVPVRKCG